MAYIQDKPTMPPRGKTSVTPDQARLDRDRRRQIKHGKSNKKRGKKK